MGLLVFLPISPHLTCLLLLERQGSASGNRKTADNVFVGLLFFPAQVLQGEEPKLQTPVHSSNMIEVTSSLPSSLRSASQAKEGQNCWLLANIHICMYMYIYMYILLYVVKAMIRAIDHPYARFTTSKQDIWNAFVKAPNTHISPKNACFS